MPESRDGRLRAARVFPIDSAAPPSYTQASMDDISPAWIPLHWNGVEVSVPADWEPVRLGRSALRVAGPDPDRGAILDCTWQRGRIRRAVSADTAAKRLKRALKELSPRFGLEHLPEHLAEACAVLEDSGLDVRPFAWGEPRRDGGVGAALYCSQCMTSVLLRLMRPTALGREAGAVLASFREHAEDGRTGFRLFGIRARIPGVFELRRFAFQSGHYRLEFFGNKPAKGLSLVLERLGPASVLLRGGAFNDWARQRFTEVVSEELSEEGVWQGGPSLEWGRSPQRSWLWRAVPWSRRADRPGRVRVWLPEGANTVLCVAMGGARAADEHAVRMFEEVCEEYAPVPVEKG